MHRPKRVIDAPRCEQARRDVCRLTAHIRGTAYAVTQIRAQASDVLKAWQLRKQDGTTYVVADTIDGQTCECADYVYKHDGKDSEGCKHVRALRALGLIEADGDDANEWPAWTDTHAFTARR